MRCREEVNRHMDQIVALRRNLSSLVHHLQTASHPLGDSKLTGPTNPISNSISDDSLVDLPTIYMITPTYTRWTQKADLTRLCQTLMHVPKLHWILVEDSEEKTMLVRRFMARCKVESTHLNIRTEERVRLRANEPVWKKNRGVEQRNLALDWLREEAAGGRLPSATGGVVYFGDDDNTYDIELFEEVTQYVSCFEGCRTLKDARSHPPPPHPRRDAGYNISKTVAAANVELDARVLHSSLRMRFYRSRT